MLVGGDIGFTYEWQNQLFLITISLGMVFLGLAFLYLLLCDLFSRWLYSNAIVIIAGVYLLGQGTLLIALIVVVALWARQFELDSIWQYLSLLKRSVGEEWGILLLTIISMVLWGFIRKKVKAHVLAKDA
jgi:hypothetical protein